ncbi:unnamed protein product [Linum trigynum]|uniref:N-acetyltransferase domain-containing protein n=1 Tax=Linum trigynum TaxID=586398 RepID=A0AAV2FFA3_9ROSI
MDPEMKNSNFSEIITLRPLEVSDVDDLMVWASDERVARFCPWEPNTKREQGLDFIINRAIPHPWLRAICLNGKPIGSILVTKNSGNDACRGEIGYNLAWEHWGKGIATKAVKMAVKAVFEEWGTELERVEGLVDVENVGSQRVLEKAGFYREGLLRRYVVFKGRSRDMVLFSILCSDVENCSL